MQEYNKTKPSDQIDRFLDKDYPRPFNLSKYEIAMLKIVAEFMDITNNHTFYMPDGFRSKYSKYFIKFIDLQILKIEKKVNSIPVLYTLGEAIYCNLH